MASYFGANCDDIEYVVEYCAAKGIVAVITEGTKGGAHRGVFRFFCIWADAREKRIMEAKKGTVYFFTGLSGAGKTTIGGLFYRRLKERKPNTFLLDGDEFRRMLCQDLGYSNEDRLKSAYRGFGMSCMIANQGIDVVNCGIAMFSEIRQWNRENIENYTEIYIKVSKETLINRNQKGLYTSGKNVVGIDIPFDEPTSPDFVIENNGDESPEEIVERLEKMLGLV